MEQFLGAIIFEFIGASGKWLFLFAKRRIQGKATIPFKDVRGSKIKDDRDRLAVSLSNFILGIIISLAIIFILIVLT